MVEDWKAQGVDLILVDCGTDPVSANGNSKLFFGILASVAEFEKGRIAERMREGRKGKAERGGHIGGLAPYRLRKVGHGRGAMLEIDSAEQATIASVKQLRDQRVSVRKIIERHYAPIRTSVHCRSIEPHHSPSRRSPMIRQDARNRHQR
jgi:DNA invertase Pin-like site-specific DNA recombinase